MGFHFPVEFGLARPILVFDSGIGGLSVLSEIRQLLPSNDFFYLFDNARLPYGELAEQVLVDGCVELVVAAATKINAALVVIACNTASTLVLPVLRSQLSIPIVGVVPAIKPAASDTLSGHIGLLATPATVKRPYTHELVNKFASHCQVHMFGSSELVMMAEQKMAGVPVDMARLAGILAPIKATSLDVLVLGCTHFPMLADELSQVLGQGIKLLDSGFAIATRVQHLLEGLGEHEHSAPNSMKAWYTTPSLTPGLIQSLTVYGFSEITPFTP